MAGHGTGYNRTAFDGTMPSPSDLVTRLMTDPLAVLHALPPWLVLTVAGSVIAAETGLLLGAVLPGASAVLALGLLTHEGVVPPIASALTAAFAAVLGTHIGYGLGRRGELPERSMFARPARRATALFQRVGPVAVCLGQWTVGVRTLTPRLARRCGMPYHRFARYSAPTAAIWGAGLVMLGSAAGNLSAPLLRWLGYGPPVVLIAVFLVAAWRHREPASR